jgi:hypothetical protein
MSKHRRLYRSQTLHTASQTSTDILWSSDHCSAQPARPDKPRSDPDAIVQLIEARTDSSCQWVVADGIVSGVVSDKCLDYNSVDLQDKMWHLETRCAV